MTKSLQRLAPALFVVLWASGFVVARLVRPHIEPESFLSMRFAAGAVLLGLMSIAAGESWPRTERHWADHLVAGILLQGIYLGGAYWAVRHGLDAAVASLICGLQPLLTATAAGPLLGETVDRRRWLGITVGFIGAALVLMPGLTAGGAGMPLAAVAACVVAMLSITFGTIWQKRFGGSADLRAGAAIQMLGGLSVTLPLALTTEHGVDSHPTVWLGLAYSVVVLSVAVTLLLLGMIKRGAVAQVTSLFYLVPAVTALMTFAMFGEALSLVQVLGMVIAIAGVALAQHRTKPDEHSVSGRVGLPAGSRGAPQYSGCAGRPAR